jgi:hypothetical protein
MSRPQGKQVILGITREHEKCLVVFRDISWIVLALIKRLSIGGHRAALSRLR